MTSFISIHCTADNEVHIQTTKGRYSRLLLVCADTSMPTLNGASIDEMCMIGAIKMVDTAEQIQYFIAVGNSSICNKHTHADIHRLGLDQWS